jgi:hypothetical protein
MWFSLKAISWSHNTKHTYAKLICTREQHGVHYCGRMNQWHPQAKCWKYYYILIHMERQKKPQICQHWIARRCIICRCQQNTNFIIQGHDLNQSLPCCLPKPIIQCSSTITFHDWQIFIHYGQDWGIYTL